MARDDDMSDDELDELLREIDEERVVPSGMGIRVPLMHMDHRTVGSGVLHDGMGNPAGFKPGFAFATTTPLQDGQREDMLQRCKEMLSEAWRNPRPALRERRKKQLSGAWRRP
jgi:hypothetical protein